MKFIYYFKLAIKQIKISSFQSVINVLGLSLGLTVFSLIVLYVHHQKNVDTFHSKLENIYRLENGFEGITPAVYMDFYKSQIPEIESACRLGQTKRLLHYQAQDQNEVTHGTYADILLVDSSFFSIFSYPLLMGNPSESFKNTNVIILSETLSNNLFGDKNPLNEIVTFDGVHEMTVVGIMSDFDGNSSLKCEAIVPFEFYNVWFNDPESTSFWDRWMYETFFLLHKDADPINLQAKMDSILVNYYVAKYNVPKDDASEWINHNLRPYKDIYLSKIEDKHSHGEKSHIFIFTIIAIFVLLIACVNYINISTASAANRFKTLAIRRVNGATRRNLMQLILTEGILVAFFSVLLSILFIEFSLPYFKDLTNLDIQIPYSLSLLIVVLIVVPVTLGFLAAIYPSYHITNFKLSDVLRGKLGVENSGSLFRKILIVFQFSISIFLIIGTLTVKKQLSFVTKFDPGFKIDQIMYSKLNPSISKQFSALKEKALENPNILGLTRCNSIITNYGSVWTVSDGEEKSMTVPQFFVDEDFLGFFGIDVVWGRSFTKDDLLRDDELCIVNRKLANWFGGVDTLFSKRIYDAEIVGVIDDIQISDLYADHQALTISLDPDNTSYIYFKINADHYNETIRFIGNLWTEFAPEFPLEYKFLEDDFEEMYQTEIQFGTIFSIFSVLSIFIACLGLFAMSSFIAVKRTKEIGIRKAHGASTSQIVKLLSKEFVWLVIIANLIAIPASWFYLNNWLTSFAYKTTLSWWLFLIAGFISLIIALSTIFYHTISTANKNPVDSLRYE